MRIPTFLKAGLFSCSSLAGLAVAFIACMEISRQNWPDGLVHAGGAIYLVLLPFINYPVLKRVAVDPITIENAKNPALKLLPGSLGFVGLLGLVLIIAGAIAGALR